MVLREAPRNSFTTELAADIGALDAGFTVLSVAGLASSGYARFLIGSELSGEIIGVPLNGTAVWTNVDRGIEGTTAASHVAGTALRLYLTVGLLDHLVAVYDEAGTLVLTCRDVKLGPGLAVADVGGVASVTMRSMQTYQGDVQIYDGEVLYY